MIEWDRFPKMWRNATDTSPWACGNRHAMLFCLKEMARGKGTEQERKKLLWQPSYVRHAVSTTFFTVGLSMIGKAVAVNRNLSVKRMYMITLPLGLSLYLTTTARDALGNLNDMLADPTYGRENTDIIKKTRRVWLNRAEKRHQSYNLIMSAESVAGTLNQVKEQKEERKIVEGDGVLLKKRSSGVAPAGATLDDLMAAIKDNETNPIHEQHKDDY